ncbi:hypothetical protein [Sphingomonas adhaesiva]|uniref:hypothetical protein n=1 Tax=Sphingomonas adhaesiva TaxID=28212 RepID=UPI002FF5E77A
MIAALFLLLADAPRLAVPEPVFADASIAAPVPQLAWPSGTRITLEPGAGELVVRYDRPLDPHTLDAFRAALGDRIDDLRWNDDTLVLRAAPGWQIAPRLDGATLSVAFLPPAITVVAPAADSGALDADLALVEADAAAGYPGQARRRAEALARAHPDDPQVARRLADARAGDGDPRGAARAYRAIDAHDRAARRAAAMAPGTATLTATARDGGDLSQVEVAAHVDALLDAILDDRVTAGGGVRRMETWVDTPAATRTAGRTIADAALQIALTDAARAQVMLAAALDDGVTGGGARIVWGSAEAQARGLLLIHMPDVSTGAQALAAGWLTRAAIGGTWRLSPEWLVQGDAGVNRYGIHSGAASDTVTLAAGIDYLMRRAAPSLTLSYRLDAEYVTRSGAVPLANRENHIAQAVVGGTLGAVQLTGQFGYTVDRFGGNGPIAALGASAWLGDGWRLEGSGGVTSIARPGFSGEQLYGRAQLTRGLGRAK